MRWAAGALAAVALAQAPARKDVVVVTGVWEPAALEEMDRPVRREAVRGEAALVAHSPVDFVNRDASVDLRQRAPHNVQTDVSIRGSTFGQTLVLLNGFRLNDAQTGHHSMDLPFAVETVEAVEVLKGSGSTVYGSDAVGGVVQFVTRPPEASEFRLRAAGGSFGTQTQRVSAAWVRPRMAQQWAASRDFSTGFAPNRDYRNLALSSLTDFRTRAGLTSVVLGHADKPFGAEQFYGNFNSWERTRTWLGALRQPLGERMEAAVGFRRHTDLFVLYRDRPQVFTNRHAVESWQGSLRRREPLGSNGTVYWGAETFRESIASTNLGAHGRSRTAGYGAVEFRALRRYSLSVGSRSEVYGSANHQWSPTAAAGAWVNGRVRVRASAATGFRLPSFTDLFYQDPANRGSPDLRPERAVSVEAGADVYANERLSGHVTVFERRERDGIDYVRRAAGDVWRATNWQRLRFRGVEAAGRVAFGRGQRFEVSYAGLEGAQEAAVGGVESRYVLNYPEHSGVLGWMGTFGGEGVGRVRLGAVKRYGRPAYAVLDVYGARARGRVRPFVQLTNVTGSVYQEVVGVAMPGRAAVGGVEVVVGR